MSRFSFKKIPAGAILSTSTPVRKSKGRLCQETDTFGIKTDTVDPELESYIQSFMISVRDTFSQNVLSIASPEEAKAASKELESLKEQVEVHLRLARSLRTLLTEQLAEEPSVKPVTAKESELILH